MTQEHTSYEHTQEAEAEVEHHDLSDETKERLAGLDSDVDSILDEIDNVLEENAQEFVENYIQRGGQ